MYCRALECHFYLRLLILGRFFARYRRRLFKSWAQAVKLSFPDWTFKDISSNAETVESYFVLTNKILTCCPSLLFPTPIVGYALQLAVACLQLQGFGSFLPNWMAPDRDTSKSVLAFVEKLIVGGKNSQFASFVDATVRQFGQQLVSGIIAVMVLWNVSDFEPDACNFHKMPPTCSIWPSLFSW